MKVDVTMPQLGETVTEGTVTKWLRSVGDVIADQDPLLEISTDKVDTEVPSPSSGRLIEIVVPEDSTVGVGTVLAVIDAEGDAPAEPPSAIAPRHRHSPLIRRLAREHGLALADLHGSGPGGRVTRGDVSVAAAAQSSAESAAPVVLAQPPSPVTAGPSARASSAAASIVVEADVTPVVDAAADLMATVAGAVLMALRTVTALNAPALDGGQHLAIRFDTAGGPVAPVVRSAADLNEDGLARRIAELAARAERSAIEREELAGATFTMANSGAQGLLLETAVLPEGQLGVLTVGTATERPVVLRQGAERVIAIRTSVYLALSYDCNNVSGGDAARFLVLVKDRLESAGSAEN